MIVLLPVSRYRVQYRIASGRPYSFFERFLLEAIGDQHTSLQALEKTFRVHRRVLIEGVVTLIQAGWIEIARNTHDLVLTKAGMRALGHAEELPKSIFVVDQTEFVIGERCQGQVARGSDVTFSSKSDLRAYAQQVAVIPTADLPHPLDSGLLAPLLRLGSGEWIRSCGPIDIVRDGADFVVVDVDTSSGNITGIPSKWIPLLSNELLERARSKERQLVEEGIPSSTDPALARLVRRGLEVDDIDSEGDPDEWIFTSEQGCVIVGGDHHSLLENWLDTARSYVAIVAGMLDFPTVTRLESSFRLAVQRGVLVDVLWDIHSDAPLEETHWKALGLLKKIEYDSRHSPGRGRLAVARKKTGSNARALLGDVGDDFEAIVGSFDWLGSNSIQLSRDISLLFRDHAPVGRIARLVADLAAGDENISSGIGLIRLRFAAEDLDRQVAEAAERRRAELDKAPTRDHLTDLVRNAEPYHGTMRVRLVVGRQHHALLPLLSGEARRRLVIAGHRWEFDSEIAFKSLMQALERGCGRVEIQYGIDSAPGRNHDELEAQFQKLGGVIRKTPGFHARIAIADDDTAVITSFDWLRPDLTGRETLASDIGFLLRGKGIGLRVLEYAGIRSFEVPSLLDADYISSFRIQHLRSINDVEWKIGEGAGPGWHVLVGDNGSGKTSILRGLALALIGATCAQGLRQDWATWIRGTGKSAEVEVHLQRVLGTPIPDTPLATRSIKLLWERNAGGATLRGMPDDEDGIMSAGYGPFRRFSRSDPENQKRLSAVPGLARHISLFDDSVGLTESLAWLRDLQFKRLENDQEASLLLDRVTKLVNESQLFPIGIRLAEITSDTVRFRDEFDYEYSVDELSDGYRSVLSLTFDIVRQLALKFGAARVFDYDQPHLVIAPGVVLIDEVDAHLHPAWQRTIGQWFRSHFPRIQFIVTTHSPLVCQAAENGSVYRLPDPNDESDSGHMLDGPARARLIYGNVLEAYDSGAFGEDITRSESSKGLLRKLAELNRTELNSGLSPEEGIEQERLRSVLPLAAHRLDCKDGAE